MPPALPQKVFRFRSAAANVGVLKTAGVNAVALANNHTLDFGAEAMLEMLRVLDSAGIAHSGAGADIASASRPAVSLIKGRTIGFVAFTDNEPGWEATASRPGVFYVPAQGEDERLARLLHVIRETRDRADFVIASAHWGPNWGCRPPAEHAALARVLIDAGADLVHGHSPHVCRGVEYYRGRPILYSTGAFIDDYAIAPAERNDRSCLFFVEVEGRSVRRVKLVPTLIRECQARLATGAEAQEILASMADLCAELGTRVAARAANGLTLHPPRLTSRNSSRGNLRASDLDDDRQPADVPGLGGAE
jgi:poly-gamma-glutamate synthesis protein (capsule biosynthesis protein)